MGSHYMFVYIRKARRGRNQKSENGYTEYNSSIGKNRTTYSVYMCYESTLSELDSKPTQILPQKWMHNL